MQRLADLLALERRQCWRAVGATRLRSLLLQPSTFAFSDVVKVDSAQALQ